MSVPAEYLEAAKVEEVSRQLASEGYQIAAEPQDGDKEYDLLATKGAQCVAVQVKARSALKSSLDDILRRRRLAHESGYDFRLIVVSPPREVRVRVEGIEETLLRYFENGPRELDETWSITRITDVTGIEIDSIEVTASGIGVAGSGLLEAELAHEGDEGGGQERSADCPLAFDIMLGHDLTIQRVNVMAVGAPNGDE